jgi:hypothetical protein
MMKKSRWQLRVDSWQLAVAILLVLLGLSCCNWNKVKKPEVFLEEQQMIDVLTDAYLIEAQLNFIKSEGTEISQMQEDYYNQLFEHYGITDSLFEQNMYYYTYHPDVLERVMDSVNKRLLQ